MLELDGGEAGGQFLRSALTLSMLTETPVRIENVRGGRPTPGLKPQHVAALEAAEAACDGAADGVTDRSETVAFEPGALTGGAIEVEIETAGSVTLVFDTLLPLTVALPEPLTVDATGGTDVKWAPPLVTYRRVKLPLLRRLGVPAAIDGERRGFYPVGGGRATLTVAPSSPPPIRLAEPGDPVGARVYSLATDDLADAEVAQRQCETAVEQLQAAGLSVHERQTGYVTADSPGSVCTVRRDFGRSIAGFDALGEKGRPAAAVGSAAAERAIDFEATGAAVDRHLADQLLLFLAFSGGGVAIPTTTDHVETSLSLLEAFDRDVTVSRQGETTLVEAPPR